MSNENKPWIPPGMRACSWDEAQWATADGRRRIGTLNGSPACDYSVNANDVTWLCIDTPKPQHTHEDKPWVKMGFQICGYPDAPRDKSGFTMAWDCANGELALADLDASSSPPVKDRYLPLRPSPLPGLKRALEILRSRRLLEQGQHSTPEIEERIIEAEIAKYEPPVCGECGRVK